MMLFNLHLTIWYLLFWISVMISIIAGVESIDLFNSLKLLSVYFNQNNQSRTPDAMLGIHFVKLLLKSTYDGCVDSETFVATRINELLDDFNKINIQSNSSGSANSYNTIVSQQLLEFDFVPAEKVRYGEIFTANQPFMTYDEYLYKVDTGSPTALESDVCLAELLNSNSNVCFVSSICSAIMSWKIESYGYQLTHKLLYYTVLSQSNCTSNFEPYSSVRAIITLLCSHIYQESILIYKMEFPSDMNDLLLEQVLLCGFNGYAEFLEERWIRNIVEWQNSASGCYEYHGERRDKRSMVILRDNCSDHMTGLAAAAISMFIRILLLEI
ncbi:UPF0764 protein C16orf89 homolog [Bradysia coprophila]|uniref:UPF0764 protein C16orf89 homolog n=1 Tax=Bradysia coprophila TaxID=38358 RepID=UPI00187DB5FD|nr:UPF0764 protein C16orf89 homolog [Bradysia coprophila]